MSTNTTSHTSNLNRELTGEIITENLNCESISKPLSVNEINDFLNADIVKVVVLNGDGSEENPVVLIPFTNADLINGKLIKLHGLNRRVVETAVINSLGVEFYPPISNLNDFTRVEVDLSRYEITGTWYLLVR